MVFFFLGFQLFSGDFGHTVIPLALPKGLLKFFFCNGLMTGGEWKMLCFCLFGCGKTCSHYYESQPSQKAPAELCLANKVSN